MDILILSDFWEKGNLQKNPKNYENLSKLFQKNRYQYIIEAVENLSRITDTYWGIITPNSGLIEYKNISKKNRDTNKVIAEDIRKKTVIDINKRFKEVDLVFILLSKSYLSKFSEKLRNLPERTSALAFTSIENRDYTGDCFWIPITEKEKENLDVSWKELKEKQLLELSKIINDKKDIEEIYNSPENIYDLISEGCGGCGAGLAKI